MVSWCTLNQYERIYTVIKMLKEYRQNKGYTQEQTAEMIGISARQYQRIEKDEGKTTLETIKKARSGLGIPDDEIIRYMRKQ